MRELSLHVLDVVQNSLRAGASRVEILINEDIGRDLLEIEVVDDGKGLEPGMLEQVANPFFTSRKSRKVGLGLALFKAAAEQCNGSLDIHSQPGSGTRVRAAFQHSHLDRAPLGSVEETLEALIACNPQVDFFYHHRINGKEFRLDTHRIKEVLEPVEINNPMVLAWLKETIREELTGIGQEV
ncbi:MAG: ATP-binding protein [Clostridia bacterium]|nr:ATP-binding protein [Clostridia bacterium]